MPVVLIVPVPGHCLHFALQLALPYLIVLMFSLVTNASLKRDTCTNLIKQDRTLNSAMTIV